MKLENKVALITGASRGIGRAIALAFAREGAKVAINYRCSPNDAEGVVAGIRQLGSQAIAVQGNVASEEDLERIARETTATYGKIDILVNNASVYPRKSLEDVSKQDWDRIVNTNAWSVFYLSRLVGRQMSEQRYGVIINIASDAVEQAKTDSGMVYGMSKAGVVHLTRSFAYSLAPYVRVNAISPGYTLSGVSGLLENNEKREKVMAENPLKRVNGPKDVANLALFLASEESRSITGQNHIIDCGRSLL